MATPSGRRVERFRFEARTQVSDGMGNTEGGWATLYGPVWVRMTPMRGSEQVLAQRLSNVAVFTLYILPSTAAKALTSACRAVNDRTGDVFDITDITLAERRDEIVLLIRSGVADG